MYGASGGAAPANTEDDGGDADDSVGSRKVKAGHRVGSLTLFTSTRINLW